MRLIFTSHWALAAVAAFTALHHVAGAASFDWTGTSGVDLFWSTPGHWSPLGPPGANDDARFFDPGAVPDATINNTVTANRTIRSLWYAQTNGIHNTLIEPGVTLTVGGTNDN